MKTDKARRGWRAQSEVRRLMVEILATEPTLGVSQLARRIEAKTKVKTSRQIVWYHLKALRPPTENGGL